MTGTATASAAAYCSTPVVTYSDVIVSNGTCYGSKVIHRVWTATEPLDNSLSSSCTQIIKLADTQGPGIWDCPNDITVDYGQAAVWSVPTADDNCGLASFTSSHANASVFPSGVTTVLYTAIDNCGNVSTCSFNVTVGQNNTGQLTCPNNIVVQCDNNGGAFVNWNTPTYSGTCSNSCIDGNFIPGFLYMGTFQGSQYYCSLDPASWSVAQSTSESLGGYLATINTYEENSFLANILTIQSAWIGLNDAWDEGNFTWGSGDPLGYQNWYPAQPNNYNNSQDYVEMLSDGRWNDQYNYKLLEFIMEIPCSDVQQISGPTSGSFIPVGTHTIEYQVDPSCGTATCSFTVTVEPSLSLECPEDITLSCPMGQTGMFVNWQAPTVQTCCSDCTAGGYIPGFVYMGAFNGHYYYCSVDHAPWPIANTNSQNHGGYLATINSVEENNFLANLLTTQSAWIGLNNQGSGSNFNWVNGEPISYLNWYPQQPNNYDNNQNYVEMLNNGQWNDQYNDSLLEYIMEIPGCISVSQTSGPNSGSYIQAGTTTTVSYLASDSCGNIETCSFDVTVASSQCSSGGLNSDQVWIGGVHFGGISNVSGNDGGYEDYTNLSCGNLIAGGGYPIHLTPGFGGPATKCFWKVWIDFNQDGDYLDTGEYLAYGIGSSTISGKITIPTNNIWNGQTTMRVACKVGDYPSSPCEEFLYGETEDYCINIGGADLFNSSVQVLTRSEEDEQEATKLINEKFDSQRSIDIYPNPAKDFINVKIEEVDKVENATIYNMNGQKVRDIKDLQLEKYEVQDLNTGLYIFRVQYNDGSEVSKRFLIQR